MIEATALSDLAGPWLWAGFLVFLRVGAAVSLAPAFGEQTVAMRLRLAVGLAFTVAILPAVDRQIPAAPDLAAGVFMAVAEILAGLIFGVLLRLFVLALQTAGTIAAQSMSLSQIAGGGVVPDPAPAVGHLFVIAGLALAASGGLHVKLAAYLIHSYDLVPAGRLPDAQSVIEAGVGSVARSFALAFSLALPFVIAALLYNLILGVINRAMPQLMVTFVGAPLLTGGSLVLLLLSTPFLLGLWVGALDGFLAAPFAQLP